MYEANSIGYTEREACFMRDILGFHHENHPPHAAWGLGSLKKRNSAESLVPTVNKNKTPRLTSIPSLLLPF